MSGEEKPEWAADSCEFDVYMRMEVMRLVMSYDDTIRQKYRLSREQEDLMNRILVWFMDRGTPQNVDSLARMVGRSWGKVRSDLDRLKELDTVLEVGNKLYPSSHFIKGSETSAHEAQQMIDATARVLRMQAQRQQKHPEYLRRRAVLAARLREVLSLENGI